MGQAPLTYNLCTRLAMSSRRCDPLFMVWMWCSNRLTVNKTWPTCWVNQPGELAQLPRWQNAADWRFGPFAICSNLLHAAAHGNTDRAELNPTTSSFSFSSFFGLKKSAKNTIISLFLFSNATKVPTFCQRISKRYFCTPLVSTLLCSSPVIEQHFERHQLNLFLEELVYACASPIMGITPSGLVGEGNPL